MCSDEKKMKVDEFLPIFSQVKKDKDVGNIDDYMECLKLYDKAGNGQMMLAELNHVLQSLGTIPNLLLIPTIRNISSFLPPINTTTM